MIIKVVAPPSSIRVIGDSLEVAVAHLNTAASAGLTARKIHDARHAATALQHAVCRIYTDDVQDWREFLPYGLDIVGPESTLARLSAAG